MVFSYRGRHCWKPTRSSERAGQAVLSKIMSHEGAAAALKAGQQGGVAMRSPNAPDLNKAAAAMKE